MKSARVLTRPPVLALLLLALAVPAKAQTPLGATLVSGGVQFALFSQNATRVELWIFANPTASAHITGGRHTLTKTDTTNHIWTVTVPGAGAGTLYGYRVWGPNWTYNASWTPGSNLGFVSHADANGHRFNPNKLLTDPYAKAVTGEPVRVSGHYSTAILGGTDAFAFVDSAGAMPKSIVIDDDSFSWSGDVRPNTATKDSIVYEVHLRGLSANDPNVSSSIRGTYDGFKAKGTYLQQLGVTAVELLPVHEYPQFDDPVGGATDDRVNYWGYMTTQFFAPNREYLCVPGGACNFVAGQQVNEFKEMVKSLHAQGIEVWLDVVFNHTFEGGACAGNPVRYINFRGIDNASYYTLADNKTCYWESTGTGNNLNASHPAVRRMILDSLHYWHEEMGVDGYRFDLAYTLGREGNGGRDFNPNATTLVQIAQLAQDDGFKVVAEAWDTAGYGVGQFPAGWVEWNGFYRDNLRRFTKSDSSQVSNLGKSVTGTWTGFQTPPESINFITAHDGFTLNDLVSYNTKQNGTGACNPTGADPNSGSNDNDSWDSGGDEVLRRRQIRNFASSLFLHHGVPMLLAGDEFRQTQYGNNNGYMADNNCGYINWSNQTTHAKTWEFFRRMIALRKAHPGLRRTVPVSGTTHDADGYADLRWHGTTPDVPDWTSTSRSLAWLIDGSFQETGGPADAPDLYVAANGFSGDLTFTVPTAPNSKCWWLLADTADWAEGTGNVWYNPSIANWDSQPLQKLSGTGLTWGVKARSTLVLAARPCNATEAVRVNFTVNNFATSPGQDIYVSGSSAELGAWDLSKAVKLNYVSGSQWNGPVFFSGAKGTTVSYKFVVLQNGQPPIWETGSDRTYSVPSTGIGTVTRNWNGF